MRSLLTLTLILASSPIFAAGSEQVICDVHEYQSRGTQKTSPKSCGRLVTPVQTTLPSFAYSQPCRVRIGAKMDEAKTLVMLEQLEGTEGRPNSTIRRAQIGFPHSAPLAERFELALVNHERTGAPAEAQRHYTAQCRFK